MRRRVLLLMLLVVIYLAGVAEWAIAVRTCRENERWGRDADQNAHHPGSLSRRLFSVAKAATTARCLAWSSTPGGRHAQHGSQGDDRARLCAQLACLRRGPGRTMPTDLRPDVSGATPAPGHKGEDKRYPAAQRVWLIFTKH